MTLILLCGGKGTRVSHLSQGENKIFISIKNKTVFEHVLENILKSKSIDRIIFITNPEDVVKINSLIPNKLKNYKIITQSQPLGVAHALSLAEQDVSSPFVLHLGDLFSPEVPEVIDSYSQQQEQKNTICLNTVKNPYNFGVFCFKTKKVVEKPKAFISDQAVRGLYFFTPAVFKFLPSLKPSSRGELEITDLLNQLPEIQTLTLSSCFDLGSEDGINLFKSNLNLDFKQKKLDN